MVLRPPADTEKKQAEQKTIYSIPISSCLAKTIHKDNGENYPGLDVETHCKIAGLAARELINYLTTSRF